jgi:hypothetical protein
MTTRLELDLRAALCRQIAKDELGNEAFWMAEAKPGRTSRKRSFAAARLKARRAFSRKNATGHGGLRQSSAA